MSPWRLNGAPEWPEWPGSWFQTPPLKSPVVVPGSRGLSIKLHAFFGKGTSRCDVNYFLGIKGFYKGTNRYIIRKMLPSGTCPAVLQFRQNHV
jgi:hypothetical protein